MDWRPLVLGVPLGLVALVSGCCSPECGRRLHSLKGGPPITPILAASAFQAAIREGDYRLAWCCTSRTTRQTYPYAKFRLLLPALEMPDSDRSVCEFIAGAVIGHRDALPEDPERAILRVSDEERVYDLVLVHEEGFFKLDLPGTINANAYGGVRP